MKQRSRHDKLLLVEIVIGMLGLTIPLFLVQNEAPDVAITWHSETDHHPGVYYTQTKFSNVSYSTPIASFGASWDLDCRNLRLSAEASAADPQIGCDAMPPKVTLALPSQLPARGWVSATFSDASPVSLPAPVVTASQPRIFHTGVVMSPVEVLPDQLYDELRTNYIHGLAKSAIVGIVFTGLLLISLRYALRERDDVTKPA